MRSSRTLEVGERVGGAVDERHRLLKLERDRDLAVVGAVVVLDRDQVQEARELGGAARLLLRRERRRDEPVEIALDLLACAGERRLVAGDRGALEGREVAVGCPALGRAALRLVLGREDQPVAAHDRRRLGGGGAEAALELARGLVEVVARAGPGRRRAGPCAPA